MSNGSTSGHGTLGHNTRSPGSPGAIKKRQSRLLTKLNMGDAKDDIHVSSATTNYNYCTQFLKSTEWIVITMLVGFLQVCILCLRAIMNNKHGLSNVIQQQEAINAIALSLKHNSLRTKALVLELLAAICLVQGGHKIILKAFDNFKDVSLLGGI